MENRKSEEKKLAENAMKGMRSFFFYMLADFAIIAGIVLVLFGMGDFLGSVIGIAGSGKVALGTLLFILGYIVLARTKTRIHIGMQPQMPQAPPMPPASPPEAGTYR